MIRHFILIPSPRTTRECKCLIVCPDDGSSRDPAASPLCMGFMCMYSRCSWKSLSSRTKRPVTRRRWAFDTPADYHHGPGPSSIHGEGSHCSHHRLDVRHRGNAQRAEKRCPWVLKAEVIRDLPVRKGIEADRKGLWRQIALDGCCPECILAEDWRLVSSLLLCL